MLYILAVVVLAAVFAGDVIHRASGPGGTTGSSTGAPGAAGTARDVDVERLRRLIREGRLSEHEALYGLPVGQGGGQARPATDGGEGSD